MIFQQLVESGIATIEHVARAPRANDETLVVAESGAWNAHLALASEMPDASDLRRTASNAPDFQISRLRESWKSLARTATSAGRAFRCSEFSQVVSGVF